MIKFRKLLGWAILFVVLAIGCSKDSTFGLCQVVSIAYTDGGDSYTQAYTYSDHKVVSMKITYLAAESNYVYTYGPAGVPATAATMIEGTAGTMIFGYDTLLQLLSVIEHLGTKYDSTWYTYNTSRQLIKAQTYTNVGAIYDTLTLNYNYPDLNTKNPSSIMYTRTGIAPYVINYTYDDKIDPQREFFPAIRAYNNITSSEKDGVTTTFAYTYNSLGYPVSSSSSNGSARAWSYACE